MILFYEKTDFFYDFYKKPFKRWQKNIIFAV